MPSTNYYKATLGDLAAHTLRSEVFPFADSDPDAARVALRDAREAFPGVAAEHVSLSVWRKTAVVPGYIRAVGEVVKVLAAAAREQESGEE